MVYNIQYLRGLAAITVVLCHIHLWEAKTFAANGIVPDWFSIGDAGVDLFFVISGFIMAFIQPSPINSRVSYVRFLANRLTRIYPPFWVVLLALVPLWLAKPSLFNNFYANQVDVWRSFLLLPQNFTPLLLVAWTLIHEVYFYFIVSFALVFSQRGRAVFGVVWFVAVFLGFHFFGATHFKEIRTLQLVFSPFSMTFLLGYFIGLLRDQIQRCPRPILFGVIGAGIVGLFAGFHRMPELGVYPNNNQMFRFVAFGLPCALLVAAAVGLEKFGSKPLARLSIFGDASYAMYLTHLPLISGAYAVANLAHASRPNTLLALAVASFIACLAGSIAFYRLLERPIIRAFRHRIENWLPLKEDEKVIGVPMLD